ncbi:MAG: zinc-binding dehydrogenase [Acidimicrobiia bacterium]|nr:zinc-binding dehydrogenase [Acidimicrobiia bacterium]
MKALSFAAPIPTYLTTLVASRLSESLLVGPHACTRFADVATPDLPNAQWVRIRTRMGGICGSDLGIVGLSTSPTTSPFSSFPFVLGHECVGTIETLGQDVRGFGIGDRVVINPLLCCEARAITPVCAACATGHHSRCAHFTDGALPAGMFIGTTTGLGGGWGEYFVAHVSQLVRVPDAVSDAAAVMTEPFACCVHAARGHLPAAGQTVLVIGAGTMGLLMVAALRALSPDLSIIVMARHQFQADHATRLGATRVLMARGEYLPTLAEAVGTRLVSPIIGRPIGIGGVDHTYVCVTGTRAVEDAMRFTRAGGAITLIGNASTLRGLDWTPLWLKELTFRGTLAYGSHGHSGASVSAFNEAADLIASGRADVEPLVTHQFPLADHARALAAARAKHGGASVKVVFTYS